MESKRDVLLAVVLKTVANVLCCRSADEASMYIQQVSLLLQVTCATVAAAT